MQKIVLTEKTLGVIVDRLRKFMRKPFRDQNQFDQNPLKANYGEYGNHIYLSGVVTVHPFYKDRFQPHSYCLYKSSKDAKGVLIHVNLVDGVAATCYHEGDTFYFIDSNTIIVERDHHIFSGRKRVTEKYSRVKLTDEEVLMIQREDRFEKEYADQYWREVEEDLYRDLYNDDDI